MGLFKKSYHVNEAGNMVEGEEPGMKSVRELRGPTRYEKFKQSRAEEKRVYQEAKLEARKARLEEFKKARITRAREAGRRAGSITIGDRLESFAKGVAGPSKPGKPVRYDIPSFNMGYSTKKNYNPFGSMFDTGMNYRKPKVKKASQRFAVVGGKAYPIGNINKKKKKKTRSGSGFDMFDNYGFMK